MKRFALGIAALSLVGCVLLALTWWTILVVRRPPLDARGIVFLALMAAIEVASWIAVLRLSLQARSIPSVGFALYVGASGLLLLFSHLLNGFTPAAGVPVALLVLGVSVPGFVVAGRLRTAPG